LEVWRAGSRGAGATSGDAAGRLIAPEFREFGSSGTVYDRETILQLLANEEPSIPPRMTDIDSRELAEGLVLLTYRTERSVCGPSTGTAHPRATLRSSLWRRDARGWQILFHQGTLVPA
jgi:hypothetical protein